MLCVVSGSRLKIESGSVVVSGEKCVDPFRGGEV